MNRVLAVVAALLLSQTIDNVATAAEKPDNSGPEYLTKDTNASHKQKKAEKLLGMIKSIGMSDSRLVKLVQSVDANIKDNKLMLYKEKMQHGELALRYDFSPQMGNKKLGLVYTPEDSHREYRLQTNAIMVNYRFKF